MKTQFLILGFATATVFAIMAVVLPFSILLF